MCAALRAKSMESIIIGQLWSILNYLKSFKRKAYAHQPKKQKEG